MVHVVRQDRRYRVIMFGISVGFITGALDLVTMTVRPELPLISHFGIVVLTACAAVFVMGDLFEHYRVLARERRRADWFYHDSLHDQLTGVYNRKVLSRLAAQMTNPYVVMVLDLDDFKYINDTYGHAVGDEVLVGVATTMRQHLRSHDHIIRTGGDEFMAILPDCTLTTGISAAERILGELARPAAPNLPPCGASIGVSESRSSAADGDAETLAQVMERADKLSYQAKHAGKSRVAGA